MERHLRQNRFGGEDEDPAVPEEVPCQEIRERRLLIRLLDKPLEPHVRRPFHLSGLGRGGLEVAIPGLGPGRDNPERDDRSTPGNLHRPLQQAAESGDIGDVVIRRQDDHHRFRITPPQLDRRQPNAGRCISSKRLDQDVGPFPLHQPTSHRLVLAPDNDPSLICWNHRGDPIERLLQHGLPPRHP